MHKQAFSTLAPVVPVIFQKHKNDCGVTCLAMIASYHAVSLRCENPITLPSRDREGVTIGELVICANAYGLSTSTHRPSCEALQSISTPSILYWRNNHFVVLVQANRGQAVIHDPQHGVLRLEWSSVRELYSGVCIEFSTPPTTTMTEKSNNYSPCSPCVTLTQQARLHLTADPLM